MSMQIFAGKSNVKLATNLVMSLQLPLSQSESTVFANGEARVLVTEPKVNEQAVILQSLSNPVDQHLIEYCLLADALTRKGAREIVGVIPWLGYSKQDKVFQPGEALSAKVVAKILQTTKMKKLITFDLHNRAILGFFDIPVTELSAKPLFLEYFKNEVGDKTVVVAPDEGAVKSSSYFARELNVPIVYMDKRRDLKTGEVQVVGMSGNVEGAEVLIVDDMIVTGSTVMETANYLKSKGAIKVTVAATHHLYVPGVNEKIEKSEIDRVVVTDTVALPEGVEASKKLTILSVADVIARELTN